MPDSIQNGPDGDAHESCAAAIQQYVPWRGAPVRQKVLMKLIDGSDYSGAEHGKLRIFNERKFWKTQSQSAKPRETQKAIADKVARLPCVMVDMFPALVCYRSKEELVDATQGAGSMIGASPWRRFQGNHPDGYDHRPPGT